MMRALIRKTRFWPLFVTMAIGFTAPVARAQSRIERVYIATTVVGNGTIKESGEKSSTVTTEVALATPPLQIHKGALLFGTLNARRSWITHGDFRDNELLTTNDVMAGAILVAPLTDRVSLVLGPSAGVRSTFEAKLGTKDLAYSFLALGGYKFGDERRLRITAGAIITNTVSASTVIPIAGLEYTGTVWRIELVYPQPAVFWTVHPRVEVGLGMKFDYPAFRVRETREFGQTADFVRTTNIFAHATLGIRLIDNLWLTAKAGASVGRRISELDYQRNAIEETRLNPAAAPYGALVLAYRFPQPPNVQIK